MTSGRTVRTPEKDELFFKQFSETANVSAACLVAGYARTSVYEWRRNDPAFAERWTVAEKVSTETLEAELYRRAVFGTTRTEPLVSNGKIVAYKEVTEYSDTAAIFLLKARDPGKYRERIDVNVNWRMELQQAGINPDMYMQQMIEAAKQKLLEQDPNIIEGETVENAVPENRETREIN